MINKERGFTLLISVLIASILFSISLGISSIIRGEIFLANTGKQSQMAYYAADAGIECALYWDTINGGGSGSAFGTSTPGSNNIDCGDNNLNNQFPVGGKNSCVANIDGSGSSNPCGPGVLNSDPVPQLVEDKRAGVSNFVIRFENGSCVKVRVTKRQDYSDPLFPTIETVIRADGHSAGDVNCDSASSRVFERSIETISYE